MQYSNMKELNIDVKALSDSEIIDILKSKKICVLQDDSKYYCQRTVAAESERVQAKVASLLEEAGFLVIRKFDG